MRLTFLGTSAGMPTIERNVTALALAMDDSRYWYLVDCGEGTQHQLLHCRYTLSHLQAIFITHVHGDHIFGLPGLVTSASMQGRTAPLTIYGPEGVESFVRHSLMLTDTHELSFPLTFTRSDFPNFAYQNRELSITSHSLSHCVPSYGYRFSENIIPHHLNAIKMEALGVPRGPLWGKLQKGNIVQLDNGHTVLPEQVLAKTPKKRVVIVGGDNDRPELLESILPEADLLIHEATFTDEVFQQVGPRWKHSTAKNVAQVAAKVNLPNLILTHFSGRYRISAQSEEQNINAIRQEAQKFYSGRVELAEDFAIWQLNRGEGLLYMGNCEKKVCTNYTNPH
ncbi:MAG: ribonuclease Z [Candidatus Endonucleobacter bathymodioli]|uniref:Ribonuclease Z n=1 Tax=Candidatus Endonucleibacter bathymodioli TaxID=539814 RepID=A0AA90SYC3_9GAMM|nr:ribonuclease Z [Candidatus Endonucleobacter bathymodioli]